MKKPRKTRKIGKTATTSEQGFRYTRSPIALFISALAAASSHAQSVSNTVSTEATSAPERGTALEEIVVTATKRTEGVQDVPISIQALSELKLTQHQVEDLDDYVKLLPSVSFQSYGPSQSQIFFRGISSGGDGGTGAHGGSLPASGLYIDEVPVTTIGNSVDMHAYDIARVEALAGPQGTLFGASSLAGTVRVITNQPDPTHFSAGYDVQGDKFGHGGAGGGMVEGYVNIPINDRMALRLVGFDEKDGGYISNVPATRVYTLGQTNPSIDVTVNNHQFVANNYNDVENRGGRAALKIDLDDHWTITPSAIFQDQIANGSFLYNPAVGNLQVSNFTPEFNKDRWYQAALTIEGKISDWDVLYAGGYFGRSIRNEADYSFYTVEYDKMPGFTEFPNGHGGYLDPTQYFSGHDQYTKQTHELRVSSPVAYPLRAVAGLFYQRQTDDSLESFGIPGLASIPNSPAVPDLGDSIFATNVLLVDRDKAVFTDVSYDILPNLTLTGGIREFSYDNTDYGFSGYASNAVPPGCVPTTRNLPCVNTNFRAEGSGETHKVNLSWKFLPEKMLYATVSTGFRPGGANHTVGVNPYLPDTLTNYEAGWKTSWLERHLFFNGAAFVEDWNKLQYGIPGPGGVINIYNAGNARVKGVESDITWQATHQLTLSGAGTYVDARLTTNFCSFDANYNPNCATGTVVAPSGTPLPIQPHLKFNGTARYSFDVGNYKPFVQGAVLHQSGTRSWLSDAAANELGPTPAFTTFDFSSGIAKDNWTLELFIQNAFDERGQLSRNTVCVPAICGSEPLIYPVKPQFFGVKFGQHF